MAYLSITVYIADPHPESKKREITQEAKARKMSVSELLLTCYEAVCRKPDKNGRPGTSKP